MAEKKTTPISVDGVEYVLEDMSPEQQTMVNHITDLDRKVRSTQFNLDQLNVGRQAFVEMLSKSLKEPEFEASRGIGNKMQEEAKTVIDGLAVTGTVATMAGWLPPLASALTIIWLSIRIWESPTVQKIFKRDV